MPSIMQMSPGGDWEGNVSVAHLSAALTHLRAAHDELRSHSTVHITERLALLSQRWFHDTPWRHKGIQSVAETTGYTPQMIEWSLDDLFRRLTPPAMQALVQSELGSLEPFRAPRATMGPCARGAHPPELLFQVLAGTVPPVAIEAIVLALLARAPLLLKTSSEEPALARWMLQGLRDTTPELARSIAVLTWKGGDDPLDTLACTEASTVVAYGGTESIDSLYRRCRFPTRFFGYGHRVSFALIGPDDGHGATLQLPALGRQLALDAAAYDQRGCMSPHLVFLASNAAWSTHEVCDAIARGFEQLHEELPGGTLPLEVAAARHQARGVAEFEGNWYGSDVGGAIAHDHTAFIPSPGGRILHVVPFEDLHTLKETLTPLRGAVSTVGLHWPPPDIDGIIDLLGKLGARRITRPGRMQRPVWLRDHDGRPRIADWIEWTDVEPQA